jgi:hypothetical protein
MALRVPFDFALMDRRHRPFVEGRRDAFLTPFQLIAEQKHLKVVCNARAAGFARESNSSVETVTDFVKN